MQFMLKNIKINKYKNLLIRNKTLLLVLLSALFIRLLKADHGFPYVYNIDEPAVVRSSLGLFFTSTIDHFDWPHFNFYFNFLFYFLFVKLRGLIQLLGGREVLENIFPVLWSDPFIFYFISRIIAGTLGALTIIPIYLFAKNYFNKTTAIISAIILTILPFHMYLSHYAVQDVTLLFWISLSIWITYKAVNSGNIRDYIFGGILWGVSSGVKYNAIILIFVLPLFVFVKKISEINDRDINFKLIIKKMNGEIRANLFKYILMGLFSLGIFLTTTPNIFREWDVFWSYESGRGFLWQLTQNSRILHGHEYFSSTWKSLLTLIKGFGYTPFLSLLLLPFVFAKSGKKDKFNLTGLMIIAVFFYLFTARYERSSAIHYYLPIFGVLVIIFSYLFSFVSGKFKSYIFILLLTPVLYLSFMNLYRFKEGHTLNTVFPKYYEEKVKNDKIYFVGGVLGEAQVINNLKISRVKEIDKVDSGSYILSDKELFDENIKLIEFISNLNKLGPNIYVYRTN
jgi:hypothetical protein